MGRYQFDLLTIGAGSGGVAASRRAASYGARVAICEEGRVGGTCVLRGCVPKKLLVYGSHYGEELRDAAGYGWTVEGAAFDWATLLASKDRELARLSQVYERMLADAGVTLVRGRAHLVDGHTVEVAGERHTAEHILVATGSHPVRPPIRGIEHVISSDEALSLPALPRRAVIVGGGYIAVEFAGIWRALGVDVSLIVRGDLVLRGFDQDVRAHLQQELEKRGVRLCCDTSISSIERQEDGQLSLLTTGGDLLTADVVLYATGREPSTAGLGLDRAGVQVGERGEIKVDERSRTSVESVYAIGDCTDRLNLTPVAIGEGRALADTIWGGQPRVMDHANVPTAVFSQPPVATVGLSEAAAREQHESVDVYVASFRPMKHTLSGRDERTMMKLVVDGKSDRVLGCHMVGADAPEIIQGLAVAIKCGATKAQFDATVGIHPTAAEEFVTMRQRRPPHPPAR